LDFEVRADLCGAFAHPDEAVVTRDCPAGGRWIEACAFVADGQAELAGRGAAEAWTAQAGSPGRKLVVTP